MATDATGTPTGKGIPKYNTAVDAPSGKGFNAAMDSIDALLDSYIGKPAGIVSGEVPVWNGAAWVRSSVTRINTVRPQDLGQDGAVSGNVLTWNGSIWAPAAGGGVSVSDRVTTDVDVVNTITETNLYSYTVPGGTLGTAGMVRFRAWGDFLYNNTNADTYQIKLKYGATTLYDSGAFDPGSINATRARWHILAIIMGDGGTSAQSWFMRMDNLNGVAALNTPNTSNGTAAVDSTAAQALVLTVKWGTASVNNSFALRSAFTETA